MSAYYYMDNNQQKGPFTKEELRGKSISRATMVWSEGMTEWAQAETVADLSEILPAIPPPPPTQAMPPPPPTQAMPPPPPLQATPPPIPAQATPPPIPTPPPVQQTPAPPIPQQQSQNNQMGNPDDKLGTGMKILSFFIPLVGLIVYFTNKNKLSKKSGIAGKMALFGIIFWTFMSIVL